MRNLKWFPTNQINLTTTVRIISTSRISETKDEQSMTLEKRTDKSSPTPIGDKIPEKETKEQLIESSRHYSDK